MDLENATLLETHLTSKNIITNLCNENEEDCNLIKQFEAQNRDSRVQVELEKAKIDQAKTLIKLLKQELITA